MNRAQKLGRRCGPAAVRVEPDAALARALDHHMTEWIEAHAIVSGVEVHRDDDATWMVQPGVCWNNMVAGLTFSSAAVERRLDRIIRRLREHGRGGGFWVNERSLPSDLPDRLRRRGFRCRKYYPGMHVDLARSGPSRERQSELEIRLVTDHRPFAGRVHPSFGRISTPIRRFELARLSSLVSAKQAFDLVAFAGNEPVGACTIFTGSRVASLWDVAVVPAHRRKGIGTALIRKACAVSHELGFEDLMLIASGMGETVYSRAGFRTIGEVGFFYSKLRECEPRLRD